MSSRPQNLSQHRQRFPAKHIAILQKAYAESANPSQMKKHELSVKLGTTRRRIQVWFQNRRSKDKVRGRSASPQLTLDDENSSMTSPKSESLSGTATLRSPEAVQELDEPSATNASSEDSPNADASPPSPSSRHASSPSDTQKAATPPEQDQQEQQDHQEPQEQHEKHPKQHAADSSSKSEKMLTTMADDSIYAFTYDSDSDSAPLATMVLRPSTTIYQQPQVPQQQSHHHHQHRHHLAITTSTHATQQQQQQQQQQHTELYPAYVFDGSDHHTHHLHTSSWPPSLPSYGYYQHNSIMPLLGHMYSPHMLIHSSAMHDAVHRQYYHHTVDPAVTSNAPQHQRTQQQRVNANSAATSQSLLSHEQPAITQTTHPSDAYPGKNEMKRIPRFSARK
ncbi:hypothetical protein BC940DRAFT_319078 [Gongronella butleri]|nr:hypothetical protein BC940DRAFT_319078 [Gongronella butleri]